LKYAFCASRISFTNWANCVTVCIVASYCPP
jgi:hypothetical protein